MANVLGTDEESGLKQTLGDTGGMSGSLSLGLYAGVAGLAMHATTLAPAAGPTSSSAAKTGPVYGGSPMPRYRRREL